MASLGSAAVRASAVSSSLRVATWNIAAINNNPFEYWMTHPDERYEQIMHGMQSLIDAPGEADVPVGEVFTGAMWQELKSSMEAEGWAGVEETGARYAGDFAGRRIVSDFLKDKDIGAKRLASMPDRYTNTITLEDKTRLHRPTPINAYAAGDMGSVERWWPLYMDFFFGDEHAFKAGPAKVCSLLQPIQRAKYPAVTEEEERLSVPLSCLCVAIFDAILVHLLHRLSPAWQDLRTSICSALGDKKVQTTLDILARSYGDCDIIFLQEAASGLIAQVERHAVLGQSFVVVAPPTLDLKRDQNSLILLKRSLLGAGDVENHTAAVFAKMTEQSNGEAIPVVTGDIVSAVVPTASGERLFLASFHGDTNGLATMPVVGAVAAVLDEVNSAASEDAKLVFGMDANTHTRGKPGKSLGLATFATALGEMGLATNWGPTPDATQLTTFHARTYLQAQLNKAARRDEVREKGDANCKDHVVFRAGDFRVNAPRGSLRDNTGDGPGEFVEEMVFPTLSFPSDHAVLSVDLSGAA